MESCSRKSRDSSSLKLPAPVYAFDGFRLHTAKLLLERNGQPVPLPPKAIILLTVLVSNCGRLLSKDELLGAVWPERIVEESNLSQYVFLLRKALGQGRNDRRYIVTMPNQGYRFVAAASEAPEAAGPSTPPPASSARWVAVLPFQYLSADVSDEYIGVGLADALITRLGYLPGIKVRPTSAVLRYADRGQDILNVAQDLGVDCVVTGTVQRHGDRVRVTVQMLLSGDGSVAWSRQFYEDFTTLFAVEDSLSQQLLRFLAPNLIREQQGQLPARSPVDSGAYHSYLKGRFFWNKRTEDGLQKAIACFHDAIEKDPRHAPSYAGLADCYNLLGYYAEYPPGETYPAAKAAVTQALELDDRLAEGHASLALVAAEYDWDWTRAERAYRRALDLNPNYAAAHSWYADLLMATNRQEESLLEIQRAQDLDPVSSVFNCDTGFLLYMARRYGEAVLYLSDTVEMDPTQWRAHRFLGWALAQTEAYEDAVAALETAFELSSANPGVLADIGYVRALSGRRGAAHSIFQRLVEQSHSRYVSPYDLAKVQVGLREHDGALECLRRALDVRPWQMIFLDADPKFDRLRRDPRFAEIARRVGLPNRS